MFQDVEKSPRNFGKKAEPLLLAEQQQPVSE